MNAIRQTQQLNKRELENATPPSASWHADYRDTAWVYVGGIPLDLSEGDVITVFSQFGNPTHLNLIRDRETGKSKGFGFLKYEDQRSCDLAVDNLTGADLLGRMLRVDHTRYKKRDDETEDTWRIERLEAEAETDANGKRLSDTEESEEERSRRKKPKPMLKEEKELEKMLAIKQNGEEEDPMQDYLIREKTEEVRKARNRQRDRKEKEKHHRNHKRSEGEDRDRRKHSHRRREEDDGDEIRKRDSRDRRRRYESVDSDGDVISRPSKRNDEGRRIEQRVRGRGKDGESRMSPSPRDDSRSDSSSHRQRRSERRSGDDRRRRSRSREHGSRSAKIMSEDRDRDRGGRD